MYISRNEAAEILNVHPQTISNYVSKGLLPCRKVSGKTYVDKEKLIELKDSVLEYMDCEKKLQEAIAEKRKAIEESNAHTKKVFAEMGVISRFGNALCKYARLVAEDLKDDLSSFEWTALMGYYDSVYNLADHFDLTRERGRQKLERLMRKMESGEFLRDSKELKRQLSEANKRIAELELSVQATLEAKGIREDERIEASLDGFLGTPLADYPLSVRALNCCNAADIRTVKDLAMITKRELLRFRNIGRKSVIELEEFLEDNNLHFGMTLKELSTYTHA